MTGSLSKQQVAQYRRDGFLFPLPVFPSEEAAALRDALEAVERDNAEKPEVTACIYSNAHFLIPFVDELVRRPEILDLAESILGPDIMVWGSTFFMKDAGSDAYISWHQDLTYWGLGSTDEELTVWLALSPATVESGCMKFVAGSHKRDIVPHRDTFQDDNLLTRGQEIAVEVAEDEAVDVCLAPGEASLHHGRMFHASGPNRSDDRRIGLAMRYITPAVRQEVGARDYAQLVRGEDRYGHFLLVPRPQGLFHPEDMARFRQIIADEEEYYYKDAADDGKRTKFKGAPA